MKRSESDASSNQDCVPCFLFRSPFRSNDPIGSPMPETPVQQRKRHQAIKKALTGDQRNAPAFSSKYMGLEKEVDVSKSNIEDQDNECRAEVHEGKVRLVLLLRAILSSIFRCLSLHSKSFKLVFHFN